MPGLPPTHRLIFGERRDAGREVIALMGRTFRPHE